MVFLFSWSMVLLVTLDRYLLPDHARRQNKRSNDFNNYNNHPTVVNRWDHRPAGNSTRRQDTAQRSTTQHDTLLNPPPSQKRPTIPWNLMSSS